MGSGLGGLVSGIILAKEGHSVCVLEKNHQAGGNLQAFTRDGSKFSTGLHYIGSLGEGETLHRFFKYLGITNDLKLKRLDRNGFDRISFGDEKMEYRLSQGWANFRDSLTDRFPDEKPAIYHYIKTIRDTIKGMPMYDLESAQTYKLDMGQLNLGLSSYLRSITGNERLRNVLAGGNTIYHGAANRTPLYLHACIRNSFVSSAWKVTGGSDQLVDVLLKSLSAQGGQVLTDAEVTGFTFNKDLIDGVVLKDGRKIGGKTVISNMHPAETLKLQGLEKIRPTFRTRIEGLENSAGFFTVYLVFKEGTFPYFNHNYFHYYSDDYFNDKLVDDKWPHTYIVYTQFDKEGQRKSRTASILSFVKNDEFRKWMDVPPDQRGQDYIDFREMKAQKLLDAVEKRYPGTRKNTEKYFVSTPVTFRDYTGSPEGTGYGIIKDCSDPVRSIITPQTKIPNLYLTGQNLNIHGVLGTTISAFITCSEFIGFKNLVNKVIHA